MMDGMQNNIEANNTFRIIDISKPEFVPECGNSSLAWLSFLGPFPTINALRVFHERQIIIII